jgi:hypothetical protein
MSKKNIIKLNEQYFSCNPINENFEDLPVINAETDNSSQQASIIINTNKEPLITKKDSDQTKSKKSSKKRSKRRSRRRLTKKQRLLELRRLRSKKSSKRGSKKVSKRGSKRASKKRSKKSREGFCAGNTCITESDLKNIINLLKNLELKK